MGAALLLGLGLALIMALGRGGKAAAPKKREELPELDVDPYAYAQTLEPGTGLPGEGVPGVPGEAPGLPGAPGGPGVPGFPGAPGVSDGTSDQAIADAREAAVRAEMAEKQAAAIAAARAASEREIAAAREAGEREAEAARMAAAAAEQAAAEAAQREQEALAAANELRAGRGALDAAAQEDLARARQAQADAERLAAEARAAAEEARAEGDAAKKAAKAAEAKAKSDQAKQAQMVAEASTKRANAEIAKAKAEFEKEKAALLAAQKEGKKKSDAEAQVAEKQAQEGAAKQDAEKRENEASAKRAEEERKLKEAKEKALIERAKRVEAEMMAKERARIEAIMKKREADARARDAEKKRQEAIAERNREKAEEAKRQKAAADKAAQEAAKKEAQAKKIDAITRIRRDLEAKGTVVKNIFMEAVKRRQAAVRSIGPTPTPPKKKEAPGVAQKIKIVQGALIESVNYLYQRARAKGDKRSRAQLAADNKVPLTQVFNAAGVPMPSNTTSLFWTQPLKTVAAMADKAVKNWKLKVDTKFGTSASATSGYAFVGAEESQQKSVNVVAAHFRKMGVDLGKPDPNKPFWKQPIDKIRDQATRAANTIPLPARAAKPPPVAPPSVPEVRPAAPAPTVRPPTKAEVAKLQQALVRAGAVPAAQAGKFVDGLLGPSTAQAVSRVLRRSVTPAQIAANLMAIMVQVDAAAKQPVRTAPPKPAPSPAPPAAPSVMLLQRKLVTLLAALPASPRKTALGKVIQDPNRFPDGKMGSRTVAAVRAALAKPSANAAGITRNLPAVIAAVDAVIKKYRPSSTSGVGPYYDFYGVGSTYPQPTRRGGMGGGISLISLGGWNS